MPRKTKPKKRTKTKRRTARSFAERTSTMIGNHRRRAREDGQWIDYGLEELRYMVTSAIRRKQCRYCGGSITVSNFSCDHKNPICRGGRHEFRNLEIICMPCNTAKGPLDDVEFRQLTNLLDSWAPEVAKSTLARLRAGSRWAKLPPLAQWKLAGEDDNRRGAKNKEYTGGSTSLAAVSRKEAPSKKQRVAPSTPSAWSPTPPAPSADSAGIECPPPGTADAVFPDGSATHPGSPSSLPSQEVASSDSSGSGPSDSGAGS